MAVPESTNGGGSGSCPIVPQIKVKNNLIADDKKKFHKNNVNNRQPKPTNEGMGKTLTNALRKENKKKQILAKKKGGFLSKLFTDETLRVLPQWISNPVIVGNDLKKDGCELSQFPYLDGASKKFTEDKITHFFPVQKLLIPEIIAQASRAFTWNRRNDMCISAATGSGKTLAYVLPILKTISTSDVTPKIRAVVVLPTQQLAEQILKVFKVYAQCFNIKVGTAIGFRSTADERKELVEKYEDFVELEDGSTVVSTRYRSQVQVVIATPGKLEAHMELTPGFDLSQLMYLVFDEADVLLRNDGGEWVRKIETKIRLLQGDNDEAVSFSCEEWPQQSPPLYAQRILLSATLSCDPELLDAMDLYNPILFSTQGAALTTLRRSEFSNVSFDKETVKNESEENSSTPVKATFVSEDYIRPDGLKEQLLSVDASVKPLALYHLIKTKGWTRTLVFVNRSDDVHDLAFLMDSMPKGSFRVAEFSAKLRKNQNKMAKFFRKGKFDVMISTDVLDRGMDFEVSTVINYEIPMSTDVYVHRVGRTARAGKEGLGLTLTSADTKITKEFHKLLPCKNSSTLESSELHQYEDLYTNALKELKQWQAETKGRGKIDWSKESVGMKRSRAQDDTTEENPKKKAK